MQSRRAEPQTLPPDQEHAAKIARIEAQLGGLAGEVAATNEAVQRMASEIRSWQEDVVRRLEAQARTPWSTLASWAAVVITICGGIAMFGLRELDEVRARQEVTDDTSTREVRENAYQHGKTEEHLRWIEKLLDESRKRS